MYNLVDRIDIAGNKISIFKPEICPFCEKGINAIIVNSFGLNTSRGYFAFVSMKCPVCGEVFVVEYCLGTSLLDGISQRITHPYYAILGGNAIEEHFSNEINEISPSFVRIYNQAYNAEQNGLDEIHGIGYRKAFEFLIKDFALFMKPEDKDTIIKMTLNQCISFVFSNSDRKIIEKTSWIGNDQTHYEKKHESFDVKDFKKMIGICISKIENAVREKRYLEDFEKEDK